MVTLVVFLVVVFINIDVVSFAVIIIFILLGVFFVFGSFKLALGFEVITNAFSTEAGLHHTHLVEASLVVFVTFVVVFEDLVLHRLVVALL